MFQIWWSYCEVESFSGNDCSQTANASKQGKVLQTCYTVVVYAWERLDHPCHSRWITLKTGGPLRDVMDSQSYGRPYSPQTPWAATALQGRLGQTGTQLWALMCLKRRDSPPCKTDFGYLCGHNTTAASKICKF